MVEQSYEKLNAWTSKSGDFDMLIVLMIVGGVAIAVFVGGVALSALNARDVSDRLMLATML